MMALIKSWALTLFIAALLCAFCETLVTSAKLKRTVRLLMSLFVVLCALSPFVSDNKNENTIQAIKPEYDIEGAVLEKYTESLENQFQDYLRKNFDENARVLKIYTLKDTKGNIYITEVLVSTQMDRDTLEEIIRKEFGENAVLVCE